jgi:quercetin dioxygenase-like cupin family protein
MDEAKDQDLKKKATVEELTELTNRLPQITPLSSYTEYEVEQGGPLFAFTLYHHPTIAIMRVFVGAGTTVNMHQHFEQEFFIVYDGELNMTFAEQSKVFVPPGQDYIPSNVPHAFTCPVNTWMVVITIPAALEALIGIPKKEKNL